MMLRPTLLLCVLALGLTTPGCFLLANTDDFTQDEGCDLELDIRAFSPHLSEALEVRLVQDPPDSIDGSRPRLLALAIFDPLPNANLDLDIPGAVPALTDASRPRPFIDFYADLDGNQAYSSPPADHTWRVEDPCDPDRDPSFPHNVDFFDLPNPIGGGSTLHVDFCPNVTVGDPIGPIDAFDGTEPLEVRVTGTFLPTVAGETEETRPVGFFRLGALARRPMGVRIPAVFDSGFQYRVEIYVDDNANFRFDSGDRGWVYLFNPGSAPDCADLDQPSVCGVAAASEVVPACKDGADIRVRLSRAHLMNTDNLTDASWISVPEGS